MLALVFLLLLASCSRAPEPAKQESAYVDAKLCAGCHAAQAKTYRRTGMARAFYRATPANLPASFEKASAYDHQPSDRHFQIVRRGDRFFHRRHQLGYQGKETNVVEHEVHYVMGSGAHARTLIHRTRENRLLQLPLGWYAEKGGTWAMSPGYDRQDHLDFRRKISFDCMFCHNAYPQLPSSSVEPLFPATLPEGIDCQRCHGPGSAHVAALGKSPMVNPAKLSADLQLELCMQCHLETTSFALPNTIQRFDRHAFSYRPGQPMAGFMLHFDHAKGTGHDDKFEIVSAAYRLRQSKCFLASAGKLTCTTCHSPHQPEPNYIAACRSCHGATAHMSKGDCLACHMPRRRTEDVIHAAVTDHLIQRRRPARDLLAPLAERIETEGVSYQGEVVLYYPPSLPPSPETDLYLAVAQIAQKSNLKGGIPQLEAAIRTHQPKDPVFYLDLAQAYLAEKRRDAAIPMFEAALRRDPNLLPALRSLGVALVQSGQLPRAIETLERAKTDPTTLHELGKAYAQAGRVKEAIAALNESIRLEPEVPEPYNSLGNIYIESGNAAGAEKVLRQAINLQPDFAEAHNDLANVLASKGDLSQAEYHYRQAILHSPNYASARYNYGAALASLGRFDQAQEQMQAAVRLSPDLAQAQEILGNLLARRRDWSAAARHYREALRVQPDFHRAHLGLGIALAAQLDLAAARPHLAQAASSPDPAIRRDAQEILASLPR